MKKVHIVILCFSAFLVLAGSILGYGLWRKGAPAKQAAQRLAAADQILATTLADTVGQTRARQKQQLVEARRLKLALGTSDSSVAAKKARKLAVWITKRLNLQVAVDWKRRDLARLTEELHCDVLAGAGGRQAATGPAPGPCRQVSSATAQRVRAAAKKAAAVTGDLVVWVGDKQVDLSPAVGEETRRVQSQAQRAVAELDRREAAFAKFAEPVEQALAAKRFDDARKLAADLDKWYAMATRAADKKRRLAKLASQLAGVDRSGDQEKVLLSRIDGLMGVLTNSTSSNKEVEVAVDQCDDVVAAADAFVKLRPGSTVKLKIQFLAAAKAAAAARLRNQIKTGQAVKANRKTIEDSIYKGVGLIGKRSEAEWNQAAGPIRSAIDRAKTADPGTAFLATLLDATKPEPTTRPSPSKPIQWVGPNWSGLDANVTHLEGMKAEYLKRSKQAKFPLVDKGYSKPFREHYLGAYRSLLKYIDAYGAFKRWYDGEVKQRRDHEKKKAEKEKAKRAAAGM